MTHPWLIAATILAYFATLNGFRQLRKSEQSRLTLPLMIAIFGCQLAFLYLRGEERGQCPLKDLGELFIFLSWSLVLFYLLTGSLYRLSLLGLFTAPLVALLQSLALLPGFLDQNVTRATQINPWEESHAAFSVLAYGALGLSAIASLMFLLLNQRLKEADFRSDLTRQLPGVRPLSQVMQRLALIGLILLTIGVITGFFIDSSEAHKHLFIASITWLLYALLLGISLTRGLTPKRLAIGLSLLFLLSFLTFGLI